MRSSHVVTHHDRVFRAPYRAGEDTEPVYVNLYGFRGDGRSALVTCHSGGLHPNAIRHYDSEAAQAKFERYRAKLNRRAQRTYEAHQTPHFDPFLHQHNYDKISVFLSVSQSPIVAKNFLQGGGGNGAIYLMRCTSAIDIEDTFQLPQYEGEKEIAIAGGVDWDDIIAFRPMVNSRLASHVFFRQGNQGSARPS